MKCYLLSSRFVLDVSVSLSPSLSVPAEIRGQGSWMGARGSPLSLWMLSLIMNEHNSGKCAPRRVEETPESSKAPEGICLWQTTSPHVESRAPQISECISWNGWRRDGVCQRHTPYACVSGFQSHWKGQREVMLQVSLFAFALRTRFIVSFHVKGVKTCLRPGHAVISPYSCWTVENYRQTNDLTAQVHPLCKRSDIKKLLNEWHWQMLSILAGVGLTRLAEGWVGWGRKQTAERARCSPEPEQLRPLAAGALGLLRMEVKSCFMSNYYRNIKKMRASTQLG